MKADHEISRDLEKGYLFVNGERMFAIRIKTFQAFVDRLNVITGKQVSQVLSDQMGKAIGHTAMAYSKDRVRSVEDLWKVGDEILSQQGCGRLLGGRNVWRARRACSSLDSKVHQYHTSVRQPSPHATSCEA